MLRCGEEDGFEPAMARKSSASPARPAAPADHAAAGLAVDPLFRRFVEDEVLPGLPLVAERFWRALADLHARFDPDLAAAMEERARLKRALDAWHGARRGRPHDAAAYRAFLTEIGYLEPEPEDFAIETAGVDPEIARLAGPQLVAPISNARYALNAANARWGSLYDALYGTDAIGAPAAAGGYDVAKGAQVVAHVRGLLDDVAPLAAGSHASAVRYAATGDRLVVGLADGTSTTLADPSAFAGRRGDAAAPDAILLRRHGLHIELAFDRATRTGSVDPAGISDVFLEAALSTILDFEDSVAAVDAKDKVVAYRNWLGLMRGDLVERFEKGGRTIERRLAADRDYVAPDGAPFALHGRSLLLVRNVGHLMRTDMVRGTDGAPMQEGLVDALVTATIALHDGRAAGARRNSRAGSIYIVKPKMHGPREVALADAILAAVEEALGLPAKTIKMGVMDEERRTSANLKAAIHAARARIFFVNTGFLDRTGDEIHSVMEAGPVAPKGAMRAEPWIAAYEQRNVAIALAAGFAGRAQIGKGMWAMPDRMGEMLRAKIGHPLAGASTAWVPSPTAATLHALHYLAVDVAARQRALAAEPPASLDALLTPPLAAETNFPPDMVRRELENNAQGILGYVVRWVDQGVGCSKVPDIDDVGLMEDRATLRISAQHIANWLHHGVVTREEVIETMRRMAAVVDRQNTDDPAYRPMSPDPDASIAFGAALALVLEGRVQPNGYTEPLLHAARLKVKG
jgi:malate synthase